MKIIIIYLNSFIYFNSYIYQIEKEKERERERGVYEKGLTAKLNKLTN